MPFARSCVSPDRGRFSSDLEVSPFLLLKNKTVICQKKKILGTFVQWATIWNSGRSCRLDFRLVGHNIHINGSLQ